MKRLRRLPVPFWVCFFVLILDAATKFLTHTYLPVHRFYLSRYPHGGIGIFKNFYGVELSIAHQTNQGAAWGMLSDYQVPLHWVRIVLILFLILYATRWNVQSSWRIPLALIIAGAIGNVVDYFIYGHVVDMFHFVLWGYDFPVFNVADMAISVGVTLLVLLSLYQNTKFAR